VAPSLSPVASVSVWGARASAVTCVLVAAVLWLGPALLRDDLFADDANQHVFWLYTYADPGLFPNDPSVEYFSSGTNAPLGYRAIYATLARVIDPLVAAEWLSVVLLVATALFAALLGRAVVRGSTYTEIGGLAGTALAMALLSRIDMLPPMAFQRSFAMPLTLMCLWALVSRRYAWVGVSWILSALLYPVIVPVLGLAGGLALLLERGRERRMPEKWLWNGVLGIAAIAIVLLAEGVPDHIGPVTTYQEAMRLPEFGPGGRHMLWGAGWHDSVFLHHRTGIGVAAPILLRAGLFAAAAVALQRRRWIAPAALVMGVTGLAVWAVARATLFTLYLPNRHSRWTVTAATIALLTAGIVAIIAACSEWLERRRHSASRSIGTALPAAPSILAMVAAPAIVAASLYPASMERWNFPSQHDLERAYRFLQTLPNDTLVAAHPDLADNVPLRAKRSVLASAETALAFHRGYYSVYVPRLEASLDAAYAVDWAELDARLAPYGVDVVLSRDWVFRKPSYYAPFGTRVARLTSGVDPSHFILRNPPADRLLFRSGDVVVVRVGS
jgi:hypothetical protein